MLRCRLPPGPLAHPLRQRRCLHVSTSRWEALPPQPAPGRKERRQSKIFTSADEAVADIKSGTTILSGGEYLRPIKRHAFWAQMLSSKGFGLCGVADSLIAAISRRPDISNLTAASNNAGLGEKGLGEVLVPFHPTHSADAFVFANRKADSQRATIKGHLQLHRYQ